MYILLLLIAGYREPIAVPHTNIPDIIRNYFFILNLFCVSCIGFVLLYYFERNSNLLRAGSEALLLNILPEEIAIQLKQGDSKIVQKHTIASILFADIVDFTPLSVILPADELLDILNFIFSFCDHLVEKYKLEKIKTIGDCYMVASGIPKYRDDHAQSIVEFALDLRDYLHTNTINNIKLDVRIGINSGPVIAGVIGHKKFIYDLWGDAVNTASRMESTAGSGKIQITRQTYELIKNDFICQLIGQIDVKGKGLMEIWEVVSRF